MKSISILTIAVLNVLAAAAQWSNTTNLFKDSLHMPVSQAAREQSKSMSIKSYPDSGYIVFWEDLRDNNRVNIYAQKYDKAGNALWAVNGVPVATGPNTRHFYTSTNGDYRNNSFAATDSSGGFYIGYLDDSIATYQWERVTVQHMRSDGSAVFPGAGCVLATTPSVESFNYSHQQLIPDGNKGFFLGFLKTGSGVQDVYVFDYKDDNGTMRTFGGGQMDANAYLSLIPGGCGAYTLSGREAYATDFYIYPDLQNGCNVTMILSENAGGNERVYTGYNRLVRVKKACAVTTNDATPATLLYPKDSVLTYYRIHSHTYIFECGDGPNHIIGTGYILDGNGYLRTSDLAYGQSFPKGVVIPTSGNANVDFLASDERRYLDATSTVTNWFTHAHYRLNEKHDSIPYYFTVFPYQPSSFTEVPPPGLDKLNYGGDTLLYTGSSYEYDWNLSLTGNKIYATAICNPAGGSSARNVLLQQLEVQRASADSFAVNLTSGSKLGVVIGKEVSTGFGASNIFYDWPRVVAGSDGNALFYINETVRGARVSPIIHSTELAWGAMGKPIGNGKDAHGYYYPVSPFVTLDKRNGTGVISWDDGRDAYAAQGNNIYMLHLDSLNIVDYQPPTKTLQSIGFGSSHANPVALLGTSHAWSTIDAQNGLTGAFSTVAQVLDDYNLGAVQTDIYTNVTAVRNYNGVPYLDRNYTIRPENNPGGTANISLRLFFTDAEFAALKAADPSIQHPGFLSVVKQPSTPGDAPAAYVPAAGEEMIAPSSWKAVSGGYYIELTVKGFSNFFIQKGSVPLPVTWLGVQARWEDPQHARVSWQVADQQNVKDYTVQHSTDGNLYSDACSVSASEITSYACIAGAGGESKNYYRVLQRDLDGKSKYSKVVILQSGPAAPISVYPNPAKDKLYISGLKELTQLNVIDISGRSMDNVSVRPGAGYINISKLAGGIYFIRFVRHSETQTIKFIKE